MEFDLEIIITLGITCLVGIIYIFKYPQKWTNSYGSLRILKVGFLVLFIAMVLNNLIEGQWRLDYIIDFLIFKKVGRWLFRISASLGYLFISWGFVGFLVIKFRKGKKPTS
jgi:hypothetical protein